MPPAIAPKFLAFTSEANAIPNVLQSKVTVFQPIPGVTHKSESFIAIWDTGATSTVITKNVVQKLGLIPSGKTNIKGVAGDKDNIDTYFITLILPNGVHVNSVRAAEVPQIAGNADILIGMDIITIGDFSVTNVGKKTVFSFRFPSIEKVDYVAEANRINELQFRNIGRNDPCPCGSKKKFKQCHGKPKSMFHR